MRTVILSRRSSNLIPCVESIFETEPSYPRENIIVVDDGAGDEVARATLKGITWVPGVKPFVFARNANIGLQYAKEDVFLLNDDTTLATPGGIRTLESYAGDYGLLSAAIDGRIGNPSQHPRLGAYGARPLPQGVLCFVAVVIPKKTYDLLGPLDERFVLYGKDDDDYCLRAQDSGLRVGICDECVVKHYADKSTFHGKDPLYEGDNYKIFHQKYPNCMRDTHR